MVLLINTSQNDLIQIKLIHQDKIIRQAESHEKFQQAEFLLKMVSRVVGKNKLKAVAVVSGPGAFSALRFGLTTANILAWSLRIPVIGLTVGEIQNNKRLPELLESKLKGMKKGDFKPVMPQYGHEPNIT